MDKFYRLNNRIFAKEIRLIGPDGALISEKISTFNALEMTNEQGLDLVEIAPKANPPVCRIMDFGKFKYEKDREDKLQKIKQKKISEIKGLRISFKEGEHDLNFKRKSAIKFLSAGNKVKIDLVMKGREKSHFDLANEKLNDFIQKISEETSVAIQGKIQKGPRGLTVIIQKDK
ncbi:MAG: translation initiation factor IF-3 [bacterium]